MNGQVDGALRDPSSTFSVGGLGAELRARLENGIFAGETCFCGKLFQFVFPAISLPLELRLTPFQVQYRTEELLGCIGTHHTYLQLLS